MGLLHYPVQRKPGWPWQEVNDNLWETKTLPPSSEVEEGLKLKLVLIPCFCQECRGGEYSDNSIDKVRGKFDS